MNILYCVVAVAVFTAESAAQSCDEGFVLLNDVCIQFDKIRLGGFKTQQERCRERGAFMIAPADAEAESSLFDYINLQWPRSRPRFWIGLKLRKGRDAGEASNYYWQNSHTKNTQFPSGTLPWEKEFPRRTPAFRCVMSTLRGSWVNARCNTQLALACQYDPKVGRNLVAKTTEEFVTDSPFVTTESTESFSEMQGSLDYITDFVTPVSVEESIYPTATESYSDEIDTESQIDSPTYETDWGNNKEGEEQENEDSDGGQNYDDDYNDDNYEDQVDDDADDEDEFDEYTFDSNTGLKMIDDVMGTKWKSDQLIESSTEEPVRFEDITEEPNTNDYDIADSDFDSFDDDDYDDDDDDDDDEDDDNWKSYQQLSESTTEKPLIDYNEDHFDDDDDGDNDDDDEDVNNEFDDFYDDVEGTNMVPKMVDDIQGTVGENDYFFGSATDEPIQPENIIEEPLTYDDDDDFSDDDDEQDDNDDDYDDGGDVKNEFDDFFDDAEDYESLFVRNIGPKMVDDIQGAVGENDHFFGSATDVPIQPENLIEEPMAYDDDDFSNDDEEDDYHEDDDDDDDDVNNEFDDIYDDAEDDQSIFVRNIEPKMVDDIQGTVGKNDQFFESATYEPIQLVNIKEEPLTYDDDDFSDDDEEGDNHEDDDDDDDDVYNELDDFYDDAEDDESIFVRNIGPKMVDDIQGTVGGNDQLFGSATDEPIQPENLIEEPLAYDDDDDYSDDDEEGDYHEDDDDDDDVNNEFDDIYDAAEDDESIFVRNIEPKMVDDIQGTVGKNDQFFGSATDEPIQLENIMEEPLTYDDDDFSDDGEESNNHKDDDDDDVYNELDDFYDGAEDDESIFVRNIGPKMVDDIQEEIPEAETKNEAYDQGKSEVEGNERLKMIDDFQDVFQGFNVDSALKDQEDLYLREWDNEELNDEYGSNEIPVVEMPYNSLENNVNNNDPIQDKETDKSDYITIVGPIHEQNQLLVEPEDEFKQISNLIDLFSALHLNKYGNTLIFHQEVENYYPASLPVGFNVGDFAMIEEHEANEDENTPERQDEVQYINE